MNTMNSLRHVLVEDGQVMIVREYHKSQGLMDDVKVSISLILLLTGGHSEVPSTQTEPICCLVLARHYSIPTVDQSQHSTSWIPVW